MHDERQDDGTSLHAKSINNLTSFPIRKVHADFELILEILTKTLPSESAALFLYTFLQTHPTFLDIISNGNRSESEEPSTKKSHSRVQFMIASLLKGLYDVEYTQSIDHLYVLVACVLILVQDKIFGRHLASSKSSVKWYLEHCIRNFSTIELILLCTLRTVMFALFRIKDNYLVYNCFAVILNISPHLIGMDNYTSERFIKVIMRICRWITKNSPKVDSAMTHNDECVTKVPMLAIEETLRVFIKALGIALSEPKKRYSNIYLMYALIRQSDNLLQLLRHPAITRIFVGEPPANGYGSFEGPKGLDAFICKYILIIDLDGNVSGNRKINSVDEV